MDNPLFTNEFGSISNSSITLNYKSGAEKIPLSEVLSVNFEREQNKPVTYICAFLAISIISYLYSDLDSMDGKQTLGAVLGILFLALTGIAYWIGHHNIVVTARNKTYWPLKVEMSKTKEGRRFVEELKRMKR